MRVRRARRAAVLLAAITALSLVLSACARGSYSGGGSSDDGGKVELTFQTLAWQTASVKANKEIVAAWNKAHPNIHVKLITGSWDNVNDQLVTAFEGGKAPDVIHYESSPLLDFADRGNLLDLDEHLSKDFRSEIRDTAWDTVTFDGGTYGVPFLQESQVVFANKKALAEAKIDAPTIDEPWTWDEYADVAKRLTTGDQTGALFALKSPTNRVLNLARNYGGVFFENPDKKAKAVFGAKEGEVPKRIHDMIYKDRTAAKQGVGMSAADALPGFFGGKYATLPAPIWLRQQLTEQAPKDFEWVTLPALKGDTQKQGAAAQTLSVSADSPHPKEATKFIEYFLNSENQVKLAAGDWLLPTSKKAAKAPELNDPKTGWDVATSTADHLETAPFQKVRGFEEWKSKVADPTLQTYFSDQTSLDQLGDKLAEEGTDVLERYQR